jgi:hypothetical protein
VFRLALVCAVNPAPTSSASARPGRSTITRAAYRAHQRRSPSAARSGRSGRPRSPSATRRCGCRGRRPRSNPMTATDWMDKLGLWFVPEPNTGCWLWFRCTLANGYGQLGSSGRRYYAHRLSYELLVGTIPDGLTIDHLCRTRCCVNPSHMEVVTIKVNTNRGFSPPALNSRKTHCINGHEFNESNTAHWKGWDLGKRRCRECHRERGRKRKRKRNRRASRSVA